MENLCLAWQEFIVGKKKKRDVIEFGGHLVDNIVELHEALVNHAYRHGGYESFFINDPKRRHIHKASVRDRLLHHAIYRILYPFFERTFIGDSYSCQVDKGTHRAISRFRMMANKISRNHTRTCWVLKCDIRKFFASIDHRVLLDILGGYILDRDVMGLLGNVIGSYYTIPPLLEPAPYLIRGEGRGVGYRSHAIYPLRPPPKRGRDDWRVGLPLGNLTSQLFTNVYMNVFDQFIKHKIKAKYYIRYADDFVFLSDDKLWLESLVGPIQNFLSGKLKLSLHPNKLFIQTVAAGVDFLGWVNFTDHRVVRGATKKRMLRRMAQSPVNETLQSYLGMLNWGNGAKVKGELLNRYWLFKP